MLANVTAAEKRIYKRARVSGCRRDLSSDLLETERPMEQNQSTKNIYTRQLD